MTNTVILVRKGDRYTDEHVNSLRNQILKFNPGTRVLCLSDSTDHQAETIPLQHNLEGWWSKLELFAPHVKQYRPFLYLDLDVLVMGTLDHEFGLLSKQDKFWMLRDFYRVQGGQSSMMWVPKAKISDDIWDAFSADPGAVQQICGNLGDQAFLETFPYHKFQEGFPGHHSYKAHRLSELPDTSLTVHFHGRPKPWDATDWARNWFQRFL